MENTYNTSRLPAHGAMFDDQSVNKKNSSDSLGLSQGSFEPVSAWDDEEEQKTVCGMRRRNFWILLAVTGALIVAIGVGAGLGVSVSHRAKASNESSPSSNPIITTDSISQTHKPTSTPPPSSESSALPSEILPHVIAFSTATIIPSPSPTPTSTNTCPAQVDRCDSSGCAGVNGPSGGAGKCTAGVNAGCSCISVCGESIGLCIQAGCGGVDGFCTAGTFDGCPCAI